ncbi:BZ3501_MvSof-1269-A2-R1_C55g00301 [Microbotryum saponariae]|nr:BZ3501_MvSof-1269-A2-R1_C55g00301 [Microbotryum saponariae]
MRQSIRKMQLDFSQLQLDVHLNPTEVGTVRRRTKRLTACPTLPSSTRYN